VNSSKPPKFRDIMEKFKCPHNPKKSQMMFSCKVSGDYELILCDNCSKNEDRQFLIEEQQLDSQEEVY
jgi:hypothetical protein